MKLLTLTLAIMLISGCTPAIAEDAHIELNRIIAIESNWDARAFNRLSGARGLCQITPVCLKEYNTLNRTHYTTGDLFDPQINQCIAYWYLNERIPALLEHYNIKDTIEYRLTAYNAGIKALKRNSMPLETRSYITKYKKGVI